MSLGVAARVQAVRARARASGSRSRGRSRGRSPTRPPFGLVGGVERPPVGRELDVLRARVPAVQEQRADHPLGAAGRPRSSGRRTHSWRRRSGRRRRSPCDRRRSTAGTDSVVDEAQGVPGRGTRGVCRRSATTIANLPSGVKYRLYGSWTGIGGPAASGRGFDRREAVAEVVVDVERPQVVRRA